MDVVSFNRYFGWYANSGYIPWIEPGLSAEIENWYNTHQKPLLMTEYGAAAIEGFHKVRSFAGRTMGEGCGIPYALFLQQSKKQAIYSSKFCFSNAPSRQFGFSNGAPSHLFSFSNGAPPTSLVSAMGAPPTSLLLPQMLSTCSHFVCRTPQWCFPRNIR